MSDGEGGGGGGGGGAAAAEEAAQQELLERTFHAMVDDLCRAPGATGESEMPVSKQLVCMVQALARQVAGRVAGDLERFAQHARRKVINTDDVLLLARNNPTLAEGLEAALERQREAKPKRKAPRKRARAAGAASPAKRKK
jgi:centromere protein S